MDMMLYLLKMVNNYNYEHTEPNMMKYYIIQSSAVSETIITKQCTS